MALWGSDCNLNDQESYVTVTKASQALRTRPKSFSLRAKSWLFGGLQWYLAVLDMLYSDA
jgi:hypothetical protein